MKRKNKNEYGLLPFIKEEIYGLGPDDAQMIGWEINKFNIANLWKYSTGEGVKVAVVDTGCDLDHPDLKNNIIQGKNFINPGKDPYDDNSHGTHCSSTIAAENNGIGMVGVAPKTKIMPVKVLNADGQGNSRDIVNGIVWAADNGADFISLSLGCPDRSSDLENSIKYAADKGCVIFCAAGNNGPNTDIMYPAKYDHTIAIGAIDRNLQRTSFTCSGDTLDFLAPGHDILGCVPGGRYALMSGTSMSTPFAVGCASLLLSHARQIKYSAMDGLLKTNDDYINVFKKKAKHLEDANYTGIKKYEGYGILCPVI